MGVGWGAVWPSRARKDGQSRVAAMDISLAKTFLTVAETGSFIEAARKLNITQSTVSARIKGLEEMLGRELFERSKTGATLTSAGSQFQKHALALVRVWQHAQLEVGIAEQHRDHLAVGAELTLWDGLLLKWAGWLRENISDIAVSASTGTPNVLTQRLIEGTLDLAVMYRPSQPPGLVVEHLFEEEFVLVTSAKGTSRRGSGEFVFVDWGSNVQFDAAAMMPEMVRTGLNLDLGSLGLDYLLANEATGYFPARLVKPYLVRDRLRLSGKGRRFTAPVCMLYPESRDEEAYEPLIDGLRQVVGRLNG
jgi:DNA-binding transcriptional LysR family regulator